MAGESEVDTSRTVVQVYVPAYQRAQWDEHAEKLDMSRSEFVKSMVQAGRRGFGADDVDTSEEARTAETTQTGDPLASEDLLRERILDCLDEHDCLSWDDLLTEVAGDIEDRIENVLGTLQSEGTIRHSGRKGGYVLDNE